MSYLARLKRKISENAPECEATKVSKAPFVPFVASESASSRQISAATIDPEAFAERAAIREFDGGFNRQDAERLALADLADDRIHCADCAHLCRPGMRSGCVDWGKSGVYACPEHCSAL